MTVAASSHFVAAPGSSGELDAAHMLLRTVPAPSHRPAMAMVARNVLGCLNALLKESPPTAPVVRQAIEQLGALVSMAGSSVACPTLMLGLATEYPAWAWFASPSFPSNERLKALTGKQLAAAILKQAPIEKGFVLDLRGLLKRHHDAVATDTQFDVALRQLESRAHSKLTQLMELSASATDSTQLAFNSALLTTLTGRLSSLRQTERQAIDAGNTLSALELTHMVGDLLAQSQQGHPDNLVTLICLCVGLGWDLGKQVPLCRGASGNGFLAWIDPVAGKTYVDLSFVLKDLAKTTAPRHHASTMLLTRPLPTCLANLLHDAYVQRPNLRTLGELCIERVSSRKKLSMPSAHHSTSVARLMNSARTHALQISQRRDIAAFASLGFELVNKSDLHYVCPRESEIWKACSDLYTAVGLGAAIPLPDPRSEVRVGSRVTPSSDWIQDIFSNAVSDLGRHKCGRRYSLQSLIGHHNAYARYVGLLMQMVAGGRDRRVIEFRASDWNPGARFGLLEDKPLSATRGRTPLPIPTALAQQIALWHAHIAALSKRLLKIQAPAAQWTAQLVERISACEEVPMLFAIDQHGVAEPLRAEMLFEGDARPLNRDFGRHLLPDLLLDGGVPFDDVQDWLRHYAPGASSHDLLSDRVTHPSLERMSLGIDQALLRLHITPQVGLAGA